MKSLILFCFLIVVVSLSGTYGIVCPPNCEGVGICPDTAKLDCEGGQQKDWCGCCVVCASQEGDQCGGVPGVRCDDGLHCQFSSLFLGLPGVCRKFYRHEN